MARVIVPALNGCEAVGVLPEWDMPLRGNGGGRDNATLPEIGCTSRTPSLRAAVPEGDYVGRPPAFFYLRASSMVQSMFQGR